MKRPKVKLWEIVAAVFLGVVLVLLLLALGVAVENRLHHGPWVLLGRRWVAAELNPEYCRIAEARLAPYLRQGKLC